MILKKIYGFIPVPIFVTNVCVNHAGKNCGLWIAISTKFKLDGDSTSEEIELFNSIVEHELVHSKQFYRTFGLHALLYYFNKKYRLRAELEAYKRTIETMGYNKRSDVIWIANVLHKSYNIKDRFSKSSILASVYVILQEVLDESREL